MKFSTVNLEPVAVRPEDAAKYIGVSYDTFKLCVDAGWITPKVQGKRLTLFSVSDLRLLWNRIAKDGFPKKGDQEPQ